MSDGKKRSCEHKARSRQVAVGGWQKAKEQRGIEQGEGDFEFRIADFGFDGLDDSITQGV